MGKFRNWLYRFMYGRNGTDDLGKFCLVVYVILIVIRAIISGTPFMQGIGGTVYGVAVTLLAVWMIFRTFSRNLYGRRKENAVYMKVKNGIKKFFYLRKRMWHDRKTHIYRKCPYCKSVLRLPKRKGKHNVTCPKCRKSFDVKI